MSTIKKTITIPEELFDTVNDLSGNFSATVTVALEDYLQNLRIEKAVGSFGEWDKRDSTSVDMVNKLRTEETRKYAKRSH